MNLLIRCRRFLHSRCVMCDVSVINMNCCHYSPLFTSSSTAPVQKVEHFLVVDVTVIYLGRHFLSMRAIKNGREARVWKMCESVSKPVAAV